MQYTETKGFSPEFEKKVVQAILADHFFAEQVMEVMDPELFDLPYTKHITKMLREHYLKYNVFPSVSLLKTIIEQESENKVIEKECLSYIESIQRKPLNGDADYVKDKSLSFFRKQSLKNAILEEVLPRLKSGEDLDSIVPIIQDAIAKGTNKDVGLIYGDDEKRFVDELINKVPSPWRIINDILHGGWGQKRLITILAPAGAGKSHMLADIGGGAVLAGKTVVDYRLELDEIETARRYDAYFTGVEINNIPQQKEKVLAILKNKIPAGGKLVIKEYPMKFASIQTIRSHLTQLRLKDIIPDIIIIDYGDLLKAVDFEEKRHNLEAVWQDMKRLAQELKIPVVTATQINRSGYNDEIITPDKVSEDFSKIMTSDVVITMARNMEQKIAGVGKIFFAKNRQGQDGQILDYHIDTSLAKIDVMLPTQTIEGELEKEFGAVKQMATSDSLEEYLKKVGEK